MRLNSGRCPIKKGYGFLLLLFAPVIVTAQIDWENYATSFMGDGEEGLRPVLVTATPYNGVYLSSIDHAPSRADMQALTRAKDPADKRPPMYRQTNTIDSGAVYFFAPGVHPDNTGRYEFRVLLDNNTVLAPWQPIRQFTDRDKKGNLVELNAFKPYFGFLGGWQAPWDHFIIVDLREKASGQILCSAAAWWARTHVGIRAVYTTHDLFDFLQDHRNDARGENNSRPLPSNLTLQPGDNSLIFYTDAKTFKKEALEYQLLRYGAPYLPWRVNDFDNNIILLQHLPPGDYRLQMRLRAQRHNVTVYPFVIQPAWHQTLLFKAGSVAAVLLALAAVFLLLKLVRQRRRTRQEQIRREKFHLELRAIRSQLNPHFIFNSLSSIQGLVNQKDMDAANRYLSEFGQLLRDSLAVSDKDLIELQREIEILDTYLRLEQLRFGFQYSIQTAADMPVSGTEMPAFLLQPLVENAVKHGVSGKRETGEIRIRFFRESTNFIAQVTDNGAGWAPGREIRGYGLKLTEERIRVLNQLLKETPVRMTIDSAPGAGTTVSLLFKNWWT
jgi:hypothetical protein